MIQLIIFILASLAFLFVIGYYLNSSYSIYKEAKERTARENERWRQEQAGKTVAWTSKEKE